MRDEIDNLLIHSTGLHDPGFIIEVWIQKVRLAIGSENRSKHALSIYRKSAFRVGPITDFRTINKSVGELKLPPKPPQSASPETKRTYTRTCTELKFQCIQKEGMVYTVLYTSG